MRHLIFNKKGSFTVEASIIFSIVFLLVSVMVYTFIIIYQYSALQSAVGQTANIGAYYYVNPAGVNYSSDSNLNLYWRIYDSYSEPKKNYLDNYIKKELENSILNSERDIYIDTSYMLLTRHLTVGIEEKYPLPIGNLFNIFGITPTLNLKAEAIAPLDDNPEFIRNMDTVIDIKNCLLNSDNKWIGEGSQVNEIIKKLIKTN